MSDVKISSSIARSNSNNSHRRLEYIDSLRGISALLVVFSHAFHILTFNDLYLNIGKMGVFIFFLISGFVIPFSLKHGEHTYRNFFISRFFRLFPAYWFSLFLAISVLVILNQELPTTKQFIANLTMIQMGLGQKNILGVYWTLFIEVIFYGTCVVLFYFNILKKPTQVVFVFYMLCLASVLFSLVRYFLHVKLPVAIPLGLSLMYFGCVWRFLILDSNSSVRKHIPLMIFILMIVTFFSSYLSYAWDLNNDEPWQNYAYAYILAIVFFVIFTTKLKIYTSATVFLGAVSYSLYLVHDPIMAVSKNLSIEYYGSIIWPFQIQGVVLSVFFSYLIYRIIELPSIKKGKSLM